MKTQRYLSSQLLEALYLATVLEMLSSKTDAFPQYFAMRGRGLARLIGGNWSSYRRTKMRQFAKSGKVIIEHNFGALCYRLSPTAFKNMHFESNGIVGNFSVRLPEQMFPNQEKAGVK